jgi:hypothetical protein
MAPLNPTAALAAPAEVDVELPVDGLARDLDLELLGDVRLVKRAAAVGAAAGQRRLVDLVDLFGAGRLAVGLGAVVLAGLAAGLLGLAGGRSLGEGGGLALAGAGCLVELAAEASLKGLAAGTRGELHTPIIGEARPATALTRPRSRDQPERDALNKYKAGDTFYEPTGCLHRVSRNAGKTKARVLAVLLVPHDAKELTIPEKPVK